MRTTLAWSDALLCPENQRLFRRLAVFVGSFTLEAAEAVCSAPEDAEPLGRDVLDGLECLVDQNLVQQRTVGRARADEEEGSGEARFRLLFVVREYALERLEASGEADALRRAHAAYFTALAEQAEPELNGRNQRQWLARLELDTDNLRATLAWARERPEAELGLRMAGVLGWVWFTRGYLREGRAWLEGLLALGTEGQEVGPSRTPSRAVAAPLRARGLQAAGWLAIWQGDYGPARAHLEAALALGRKAGDRRTVARALNSLGVLATRQGDLTAAAARFSELLARTEGSGTSFGTLTASVLLGGVAYRQGHLKRAARLWEQALARARAVDDPSLTALASAGLGQVALREGDLARALALGREALALHWQLGDQVNSVLALEYLASALGNAGARERSARLLGATAAWRETTGAPQDASERADIESALVAARIALGEERWDAAFAAGRARSLEDAIAEALGQDA
jgi:tetratricopeptide (TPR) repeat protein